LNGLMELMHLLTFSSLSKLALKNAKVFRSFGSQNKLNLKNEKKIKDTYHSLSFMHAC